MLAETVAENASPSKQTTTTTQAASQSQNAALALRNFARRFTADARIVSIVIDLKFQVNDNHHSTPSMLVKKDVLEPPAFG